MHLQAACILLLLNFGTFMLTLTTADDNNLARNLNSAFHNISKINKLAKIGRKERCRHVVRKEVQKYSRRVQALTDRVLALQQDVMVMSHQQKRHELEMELLRRNLTGQNLLLTNTAEDVGKLRKQLVSGSARLMTTQSPSPSSGIPRNCLEVYNRGSMRFPGTYEMMIQPKANTSTFQVLCEATNNAGWVVMQFRVDGSVSFQRNWYEYKKGFGTFQSEFWLGNEHIHHLTAKGPTTLRIELEEFSGRKHWAEYSKFAIDNEKKNYTIHISGYMGNAGDALSSINGQQFSTIDRDNDNAIFDSCARQYSAGWWYNRCQTSNINGQYLDRSTHDSFIHKHGIVWPNIHPFKTLKSARLLLKPT